MASMQSLQRAGLPALIVGIVLFSVYSLEAASSIDGSRAWRDLQKVVGFGPRPSGSPESERTRRYIVEELRKAGVKTRVQSFTAETGAGAVKMANVIGEIPGRSSGVILIAGHYDTKYFPSFRFVGANDGGSSTALLIELARSLAGRSGRYTVWIVFFDGEEERSADSNRGASYGARFMVDEMAKSGDLKRLRAAVVIDMIGDRNLDIRRDAGSTWWLTDMLWRSAARLGYKAHFLDEAVAIEDDHVPLLQAGIPAALLIDYNYGPGQNGYWHTREDTPDKLSAKSLKIVGDVVADALSEIESELNRAELRR
jgi:Zn-dependent M28 family amino/carboxypeptidase